MGYCLIPTTVGQKMLFIVGNGGEGNMKLVYEGMSIFKYASLYFYGKDEHFKYTFLKP